jgi:flagellar FliL protein
MMSDDEEEQSDKTESAEGSPEGGEAAEGEGKKGPSKKLILIIAGVAVLLVGGGAAAYFTGMLDGLLGKKEAEEGAETAEGGHGAAKSGGGGHGEEVAGGGFIVIPTMIVNLDSADGTPRYLRLSVQLELENPADKPAVEAVIPRVVDQFQTYLRELRVKDLRGSAGIYRLQMELLWRVNQAAAPIEIKDVLFQEILIQ